MVHAVGFLFRLLEITPKPGKTGLTWTAGCAMLAAVDCEIPLADLRIKIPSVSKFKLNFS